MLHTIVLKELRELTRDGRFRATAITLLILLLAALGAGVHHYQQTKTERVRAASVQREQWTHQGEKGPHAAAHFGLWAFKPAQPLSLADRGVETYTGVAIWVEAHKQNDVKFAPAQQATALQRLGELTASTILQLIVPLFITFFSFGAFTTERERGTLRLTIAQGVSPQVLTLGKALGIIVGLSLVLVPATLLGACALLLTGNDTGPIELLARLALLTLAYLLYFGSFLALSLLISAVASSPRTALLGSLTLWIVGCLLLPRLAIELARTRYPTPTAAAFSDALASELASGPDGHSSQDKRLEALKKATMQRYGVARLEDLPVGFEGLALQAGEDWGYPIFDAHYARLWALYAQQEKTQRSLGALTPLIPLRALSMGLSGTDRRAHQHFAQAVERYRRLEIQLINQDIVQNARTGDSSYKAGRALWEKIPPFTYKTRTLSSLLGDYTSDLVYLVGGLLLTWSMLLLSVRRLRVLG